MRTNGVRETAIVADQKKTFASLKLQSINKTYTVLFTKIQRNQSSRSQKRKTSKGIKESHIIITL